jgi:hypothetical protein
MAEAKDGQAGDPLQVDGVAPGRVTFQPPGAFGGPKLLVDGQPAQQGDGRMTFLLPSGDGGQVSAKLIPGFLQAAIEIGGAKHPIGPKVPIGLFVLAALPIGLVSIGGVVGGAFGGAAFGLSLTVARSDKSLGAKAAIILGIGTVGVVAYLIVGSMIYMAIN